MRIEKVTIKNFKGIKEIDLDIYGKNVYITGGNAKNKTSFIDAIFGGLDIKNLPTAPIKSGESKGLIEIDLGDFIARTKFKKNRPVQFELENKVYNTETEKFIKSPRTYLNKRLGVINFDVNEFFSMNDSDKLKYFAKILDADFNELDIQIDEVMESRKFDKKKLAELNTKVEYFSEEDAKKEPIDIIKLSKEIATLEHSKSEVVRIKGVLDAKKEELEALKLKMESLAFDIIKGNVWIDSQPINQNLIDEKNELLNNSNSENEKIKKAKDAKNVDEEIKVMEEHIKDQDKQIAYFRKEKSKKISSAINVTGLTYNVDESKFYYQGLPFEKNQINTASQLIAGMHIASTLMKELRIVKIDASLIDKPNFEKALAWANENDIEMFIELVDREGSQLNIEVV